MRLILRILANKDAAVFTSWLPSCWPLPLCKHDNNNDDDFLPHCNTWTKPFKIYENLFRANNEGYEAATNIKVKLRASASPRVLL